MENSLVSMRIPMTSAMRQLMQEASERYVARGYEVAFICLPPNHEQQTPSRQVEWDATISKGLGEQVIIELLAGEAMLERTIMTESGTEWVNTILQPSELLEVPSEVRHVISPKHEQVVIFAYAFANATEAFRSAVSMQ
jgi:primosomal protein N'